MTLGPGIQEWTNGMNERDEQKTATKKAGNSAARRHRAAGRLWLWACNRL